MLKNAFYLFSGSATSAFLNLLVGYFILSYLSAEEYGRYGVAVDFLNMLTLILGSFLTNALQRYTALYRASKEKELIAGMLKLAILYSFIVSTIIFLPSFLFPDSIAKVFLRDQAYAPFLRLYALAVPFIVFATHIASFMKGMGMFARVGLFDITLPTVVRSLVVFLGLPLLPGYGPYVVTFSSVSKFVSNFLFNFFTSWKVLKSFIKVQGKYRLKEWMRYSSFVWGRYALSILSDNIKSVLVGSLKGATQGGVFKVAFLVLSPVYMLETSLMSVLFTRLSEEIGQGKDVSKSVHRYTFYVVVAEILFGLLLVFVGPFILKFFGKGYEAASPLLMLILSASVMNSASSVHRAFFLSVGRSDFVLLIHAGSALISTLGGFFLVRSFGTAGGVYTFVAETVSNTLVAFFLFKLKTRKNPVDKKTVVTLALFLVLAFATSFSR